MSAADFEAGRRAGTALGWLLVCGVVGGLVVAAVMVGGALGLVGILLGARPL